jgi:hypothetical protein
MIITDNVELFINIARQYYKSCLSTRNKFGLQEHHYISDDNDKFKITFYFGTDYDTWAIECDAFEYRAFENKFIIDFDETPITKLELNLAIVNNFLTDHLRRFENRVATKRKLTF